MKLNRCVDRARHVLMALVIAGLVSLGPVGAVHAGAALPAAQAGQPAKNVIVMISDGGGFNQIDAASLYEHGTTGGQAYEAFPVKLAVSTFLSGGSYNPDAAWGDFSYVLENPTDSAAAATAMATGVKTNRYSVGVDAQGNPVGNLVEKAEERGKSTGVVTTVPLSHATPAGFVAHNNERENHEQIAQEMIVHSAVDVIMGAGHPLYDDDAKRVSTPVEFQYVGGTAVWDALLNGVVGADADGDGVQDPWTLIQEQSEFQSLGAGPTPDRVIGVARAHTTLQQARSGDELADAYTVPMNDGVPTLTEMAVGALNVLDEDPEGFFLMIEGGAGDWAGHKNQSGRLIEEQITFNRAVEAVIDWVEVNSNWNETLLVVTADHETGYLTGPNSDPGWNPLVGAAAGRMPAMEWHTEEHTNQLVPFFARGAGSALFQDYADQQDPKRGPYIDNTEIARVLSQAMTSIVPTVPTDPVETPEPLDPWDPANSHLYIPLMLSAE